MDRNGRKGVHGMLGVALGSVLAATAAAGNRLNRPPRAPAIREPETDGLVVNPADVHMETGPFSDPDAGDQHGCTDWQIWRLSPVERVWYAPCTSGVERVHIHLGDGVFENSHAGRSELLPNTVFHLFVRHSDDSGDPATEWSEWSERVFRTASAWQVFPLEMEDVARAPVPRWIAASDGSGVILPPGGTPPTLRLESAAGGALLSIEAEDGATNTVTNPSALAGHGPARILLQGGSAGLTLPATDLLLVDEHCETHRVLLPALAVAPLETLTYWISTAGATYVGTSSQTSPVFSMLARGLATPWSTRQPGYRVEVFAGGLQLPVNIAFVPNAGPDPDDPFLYVTELYGAIRVVTRDGTVGSYASGLLNFNPTGAFPGSGEQGLAGIAVDPATGDVYASLLYASAAAPSVHFPKIVRFTSQDGGSTAATETTVLDMVNEIQGQSHQISNLTITEDGKLLCHMGDGFDTATAQDLESFRGKILRLNLDGSPAADNPFFDASDGVGARDYVYAYGVRNPFGGDRRAADGVHYVVENGPNRDRFAQVVAGRNFGWDGSNQSMGNYAIYNWWPARGPVNLVFVQSESFGGSGFPASAMGHAFVSESGPTYATGPQWKGKRVTEWVLDATGRLTVGPIPFLEYAGNGKATACGLEAGPDGLYMTELYDDQGTAPTQPGARILRIRYEAPPDCDANGIEDVCDIASGESRDENANWVPDTCESGATPFCFGDGTGIPCPCSNTGAAGHGCANSAARGGALLVASGGAFLSVDTLRLTSSGELPASFSWFLQGDAEVAPQVFGDGLGCAGGQVERLYSHGAVGGTVTGPQGSDAAISARSAVLGDPIASGTTRIYHVLYRDGETGFCPAPAGSTINTTNGLRVLWGP